MLATGVTFRNTLSLWTMVFTRRIATGTTRTLADVRTTRVLRSRTIRKRNLITLIIRTVLLILSLALARFLVNGLTRIPLMWVPMARDPHRPPTRLMASRPITCLHWTWTRVTRRHPSMTRLSTRIRFIFSPSLSLRQRERNRMRVKSWPLPSRLTDVSLSLFRW